MIAVDTNVIVRLLTRDDLEQTAYAASLFAANQIWIAKTVLLEVNWALTSVYKYRPEGVREALENLVGLPNVLVEDESAVTNALALSAQGIDFADALHLESRPQGVRFASFDQAFVRRAQKAGFAAAEILDSKTF
jgi:predicted nucleic-acid-binding protein